MTNSIVQIAENAIIVIYFISAFTIFLYGLNCYVMLYLQHRKATGKRAEQKETIEQFKKNANSANLPKVTIQIPIFNELNVAERVIIAAAEVEYPASLLEIQVLDDSTDETSLSIEKVVARLKEQGKKVNCIHRSKRTGYKAGALANGLNECHGEFIAIFDADFVPPKNFLNQTIPFFLAKPTLGLIQARWGHLNAKKSLLTRAQSVGIDGHFMIEQSARSWNGLYMNFNGTAGIWRKVAIAEAGGWQSDTLTEDMDLSYRMQMAGWQTEYLVDLIVPAEIPEDINAFKSQQFRWAKGSIQTALKLLPRVYAQKTGIFKKIQATLHMTHYLVHPLMLTLALFSLPVLLTFKMPASREFFWLFAFFMTIATFAPSTLYLTSQRLAYKDWKRRILILPFLVTIGIGLAVSNSLAVIQALIGKKSEFVRTPKNGDKLQKLYRVKVPWVTFFEIATGLYCLISFLFYLNARKYLVGPFLGIYSIGFLFTGILTLLHSFRGRKLEPLLSLTN